MGRHDQVCSVCALPAEVLAVVNAELAKPPAERMSLRELEKQSGRSKSALSKHARRCLPRETLRHHRNMSATGRRVVWDMGDGLFRVEDDEDIDRRVTADQLQPNDVIITMSFGQKPITNPAGLTIKVKKRAETAVDEPQGAQPPSAPESTETTPQPPQQCDAAQPDAPPQPEIPCEHQWLRVAGDVHRCKLCSLTEDRGGWKPKGQSRAEHFSKKSGLFGRG